MLWVELLQQDAGVQGLSCGRLSVRRGAPQDTGGGAAAASKKCVAGSAAPEKADTGTATFSDPKAASQGAQLASTEDAAPAN